MSTTEQSIDVNVPVHTAYNQWTQFEEFPRFMEGVEEVRQLDDRRLHWRANIGGRVEEWDAVITEQHPDERIAWKNTTGAPNAGVVTFHRLADNKTASCSKWSTIRKASSRTSAICSGWSHAASRMTSSGSKSLSKRGATRREPGGARSSGRASKRRLGGASRVTQPPRATGGPLPRL